MSAIVPSKPISWNYLLGRQDILDRHSKLKYEALTGLRITDVLEIDNHHRFEVLFSSMRTLNLTSRLRTYLTDLYQAGNLGEFEFKYHQAVLRLFKSKKFLENSILKISSKQISTVIRSNNPTYRCSQTLDIISRAVFDVDKWCTLSEIISKEPEILTSKSRPVVLGELLEHVPNVSHEEMASLVKGVDAILDWVKDPMGLKSHKDRYDQNDELRKQFAKQYNLGLGLFSNYPKELRALLADLATFVGSVNSSTFEKTNGASMMLLGLEFSELKTAYNEGTALKFNSRESILANFNGSNILRARVSQTLDDHYDIAISKMEVFLNKQANREPVVEEVAPPVKKGIVVKSKRRFASLMK